MAIQTETLRRMEEVEGYSRWLVDRARPYLGRRVLDVGAGIGSFSEMIAEGRELLVALEPDQEFARRLRDRLGDRSNVLVVAGSVGDLPAELPPLDSALCFNVLEHIADDAGALASLRARLTPGGHLLLLTPAHPFLFGSLDRELHHERRYRRRELGRLLAGAGFELEQLRYVNPLGGLGWLVCSRLLRRPILPRGPLRAYDRLVPLMRALDGLRLPFGLSVWAVARAA
jgi:SAM-dependent methyltransferase